MKTPFAPGYREPARRHPLEPAYLLRSLLVPGFRTLIVEIKGLEEASASRSCVPRFNEEKLGFP